MQRKAQRILNNLIKDLKAGGFKYKPKKKEQVDWSAYNLAQINEMNCFLEFITEAIEGVRHLFINHYSFGRPSTDALDLAKLMLVQAYFQSSERLTSGLAELFKEKLKLNSIPSPRTIGRAYKRPDVLWVLNQAFQSTLEPIVEKETSFSGDGTGMSTSIKKNYANDRSNKEAHTNYDKMVVMVANNFHIATAFEYGKGTANDSPFLKLLVEKTHKQFNPETIQFDAGFLSRDNCSVIGNTGAIPYIYPKEGVTINKKGSKYWTDMLYSLITDPQIWLEEYHIRSNSECYFSSFKRRFARPLQKKSLKLREVEAFCRIIVLNVCMLIRAYFEGRVEVSQFRMS